MNSKNEFKRLGKHVGIYTIGNGLARGGAFILIPLYTKYLIPSQYGMLELFYSLSSIISSFVAVGLSHATLRFYFEYDNPNDRRAVVSTSMISSFCLSLAGVLLLSIGNSYMVKYFFEGRDIGYSLVLVYATLVIEMTTQVGFAYLRAEEFSKVFILSSLCRLVVQVGTNLFTVVVLRKGVEGILFGNFMSVVVESSIVSYVTMKHCGIRFDRTKLDSLVRYSFPFLLTAVVAVVVRNMDRFLLGSLQSLARVGIYALSLKFGLILSVFILEPFQRGYGAFRFSIIKQDNAKEIQSQVLVYVVSCVTFVGLCIALFSKEILQLMGATAYYEAAGIVPMVILAVCIGSMGYIFQTGILYQKETKWLFYISSTSSLFNVITMFFAIYAWGMVGAVWAGIINVTFNVVTTNFFSQKLYPVPYKYIRILSIYLSGILIFGVGVLAMRLPQFYSILIRSLLGPLFGYSLLVFKVISSEDIKSALAYLKSSGYKMHSILNIAKVLIYIILSPIYYFNK
jgi:O-antigen/teichoic acid export membrane protein